MYNPDDMDSQEILRTIHWSISDEQRKSLLDDPPDELEAAMMQREAERQAESYGPAIVALLVERAQLKPHENPLEVLKRLVPDKRSKRPL